MPLPPVLDASKWRVYGGVVSQDKLPSPYLVEKIIVNENYNNVTNDQDIAILKLASPVDFTSESRSIPCISEKR